MSNQPQSFGTVSARVDEMAMPSLAGRNSPRTLGEALPLFLTHGSPRILLVAVVAALAVRLPMGQWSAWDVVPIVALLLLWPIQEWLIHVYILHFKPFRLAGRQIDFRVPRKHREHHRDPWNYQILFIPMQSFLYTVPLVYLIWTAVMPTTTSAWTGIVGHFVLALHYEWIHFLVHTRVQPKTAYYRRLWDNHRLHHFKSEHYWFGVTRTEADWVLGTAPGVKEVPTSRTCRDLLAA